MSESIDSELTGLFGRWTLAAAQIKCLDDLNVDPDVIKAAAHRIIKERGHPERQRAIVVALEDDTRSLCASGFVIEKTHPASSSTIRATVCKQG